MLEAKAMRAKKLVGLERLLFWLLLAFAFAARLFGAWCFRHIADSDASVAGLMSRHIAQGSGWPVFFYGQPYMGSLEPSIGALFCLLLGDTGLAVCLGTALVAFAIVPVVYAWAREAAGAWAGLAAMALIAIGPAGYYPYLCQPRGGYAVIILSCALMLWLAAGIAGAERVGKPRNWMWFFALGLSAGVGWWTSGLTAAAIAAAALTLLAFAPRALPTLRAAAGFCGFLIGSAPFWVWNASHSNAAVEYLLNGAGSGALARHLALFCRERLPAFLGLTESPVWIRIAVISALLMLVASAVFLCLKDLLTSHRKRAIHLSAIFIFLLFWLALFCRSLFADLVTPRYLTPLAPPLAVLFGIVVAGVGRRLLFAVPTAIACAILLFAQPAALFKALKKEAADLVRINLANNEDEAMRLLRPEEDTFYLGFPFYWRNFNSKMNFCFTPLAHERYQPFFERAEYSDGIATRGNFGSVIEFLIMSGGKAGHVKYAVCDFEPPPLDIEEAPSDLIEKITFADHADAQEALLDGNLDTPRMRLERGTSPQHEAMDIAFKRPIAAAGIRLMSRNFRFSSRIRIDAWQPGIDEPVTLISETKVPGFFWSGPRPFWKGRFYRIEYRWHPLPLERLRVCFCADASEGFGISEAQVFQHAPEQENISEQASLPELLVLLEERKISHLYADRWVANAVHRETDGRVLTEREPGPEELLVLKQYDLRKHNRLRLKPGTAVLALNRDVPLCRRSFSARGLVMRETNVGPWTLFDLPPDAEAAEYQGEQGLYWAGFACLLADDIGVANAFVERAAALRGSTQGKEQARALLERAAACAPDFEPALTALADLCEASGRLEEALHYRARALSAWTPDVSARADFAGGISFLGVSISSTNAAPGDSLAVKYYWKHPALRRVSKDLCVFVHFTDPDGRPVFQDDHGLLTDVAVEEQPVPLVFVEERAVVIPDGIEPGDYAVRLGLYRRNFMRIRPGTELPVKQRALLLPLSVRVARP